MVKKSVRFSETTATPLDVLFRVMKSSKLKSIEFKVMENREKAANHTFYKLDRCDFFCLLKNDFSKMKTAAVWLQL